MLGCGRNKYCSRDDSKSRKSILGELGVISKSKEGKSTPMETSLTARGSGEDVGEGGSDTVQCREQDVCDKDGQTKDEAGRTFTLEEAIHTGMIRDTPSEFDNLTTIMHMARMQENNEQEREEMTGDGVTDAGRSKRRKVEDNGSFTRSNSITSGSSKISSTATIDRSQVQDSTGVTPAVSTSLTVTEAGTSEHTAGSNASPKYPTGTSSKNGSAQTRSLAARGSTLGLHWVSRRAKLFSISMRPNLVLEKAMAAFGEKFGVDHKCLEFSCRGELLTGDHLVSHVEGCMVLARSKMGTGLGGFIIKKAKI